VAAASPNSLSTRTLSGTSSDTAGAPALSASYSPITLHRREDARLVTGKGRFGDDFNMARQAYAALARRMRTRASSA
jgi:hypothetical protein